MNLITSSSLLLYHIVTIKTTFDYRGHARALLRVSLTNPDQVRTSSAQSDRAYTNDPRNILKDAVWTCCNNRWETHCCHQIMIGLGTQSACVMGRYYWCYSGEEYGSRVPCWGCTVLCGTLELFLKKLPAHGGKHRTLCRTTHGTTRKHIREISLIYSGKPRRVSFFKVLHFVTFGKFILKQFLFFDFYFVLFLLFDDFPSTWFYRYNQEDESSFSSCGMKLENTDKTHRTHTRR